MTTFWHFPKKGLLMKLTMLTAYDYPTASIADLGGVDLILVGDSAANVVHGFKSTSEISLEQMLVHTAAVSRANPKALIVGDMPFGSYKNPKIAVQSAKKFIAAGANLVKLEGEKIQEVKAIRKGGIKVMGHLGYLPQTDAKPKVKGRKEDEEKNLLAAAKNLQAAGCSYLVLELVPQKIAQKITRQLSIPTIGIGAGKYCSGQVLVFHDLLGLNPDDNFRPRFLKRYANLKKIAIKAVQKYVIEVKRGKFPSQKNAYE